VYVQQHQLTAKNMNDVMIKSGDEQSYAYDEFE
jgi:hypothetical protein